MRIGHWVLEVFFFAAYVTEDDERDEDHDKRSDEEEGELLEEIHECFANVTLLLIIIHILGVVLVSVIHREILIRAMVTGHKRVQ